MNKCFSYESWARLINQIVASAGSRERFRARRRPQGSRGSTIAVESLESRRLLSASAVLVQDIQPGIGGALNITNQSNVDINGTLYFTADDGTHGVEVWKSDGTATGTVMVKDIIPGAGSANPTALTNVGGTLFFATIDASGASSLWKSDGTAAGTVEVKSVGVGSPFNPAISGLTEVGGELFFLGNDGIHGAELWKSNGTSAGTVMVKDIKTVNDVYGNGSFPQSLTNLNGKLVFTAHDGIHRSELWISDGTEAGTLMVKNINTKPHDPRFGNYHFQDYGSNPMGLAVANGTLYFTADDGTHGAELWKSDGTAAGTTMVKDLNPAGSSIINQITPVGSTVYFVANDMSSGSELWKSDGTDAGTTLVRDLAPGGTTRTYDDGYGNISSSYFPNSSDPSNLTNVNGTLFFVAANDSKSSEYIPGSRNLWKTDGTAGGTVLVKESNDTNPNYSYEGKSNYGLASQLTNVAGTLYFVSGSEGDIATQLWSTDGTVAGTVQITKPYQGPSGANYGASPQSLTNVGGRLFFSATDSTHGRELWRVNAAPEVRGFDPEVISYIENGTPQRLDRLGKAVVVDSDSPDFAGGTLTVQIATNGQATDVLSISKIGIGSLAVTTSGSDVLVGGITIGTFSGGTNTSPLVVTFNSAASSLRVQAVLRAIAYSNSSDNPSVLSRTVHVTLSDGDGGTTPVLTKTVQVKAINDAPVVTGFAPEVITYVENGVPKLLDRLGQSVVVDPDSPDFSGGKLTVWLATNGQKTDVLSISKVGTGALAITTSGSSVLVGGLTIGTFTGGTNQTPLTITFNSAATPSRVQTLLRAVAYSNTSDNPSALPRTVRVTLSDGDGGITPVLSKTVRVTAVNDAPVVTGFDPEVISYVENGTPQRLDRLGKSVVVDPDSANFAGGKLTVSIAVHGEPTDRLSILRGGIGAQSVTTIGNNVFVGGIAIGTFSGGTNQSPLVVILNAAATPLRAQTLLRAIAFSSTSDNPSTLSRTVHVTLSDGDGGVTPVLAKTVQVTAVNDGPVVTGFDLGVVVYSRNASPQRLDRLGRSVVVDPDSPDFAGGKLTVSIPIGGQRTDILSIVNVGTGAFAVKTSGSNVLVGGVTIGTFSGGTNQTPLVVTFNSASTPLRVQTLLRAIAFSNSSDRPSLVPRIVSVTLSDGDGAVTPVLTKIVLISPV